MYVLSHSRTMHRLPCVCVRITQPRQVVADGCQLFCRFCAWTLPCSSSPKMFGLYSGDLVGLETFCDRCQNAVIMRLHKTAINIDR